MKQHVVIPYMIPFVFTDTQKNRKHLIYKHSRLRISRG